MTKLEAIAIAKTFRKDADALLQRMKEHVQNLRIVATAECENLGEVIAQHMISTRDLEGCIMRQGMVLKYIGNPKPVCPCCNKNDRVIVSPNPERGQWFCPCNEPGPAYFNAELGPYPTSYDPTSSRVEPTADGLKL